MMIVKVSLRKAFFSLKRNGLKLFLFLSFFVGCLLEHYMMYKPIAWLNLCMSLFSFAIHIGLGSLKEELGSLSCSLLCDNILGNNFVSFFRVIISCIPPFLPHLLPFSHPLFLSLSLSLPLSLSLTLSHSLFLYLFSPLLRIYSSLQISNVTYILNQLIVCRIFNFLTY